VLSALGTLVLGLAGSGLTFVVFGTVAFSLVMSVLFLVTRGSDSMYDQIGAGGISREGDESGLGTLPEPPGQSGEQEQEIRQMLRARSDRRVSRGEEPLDIDAEVARLLADAQGARQHDAALVAEVRQLVQARNERRLRQGQAALDVDAEIARTLEELDPRA
jgi:hypothetical protein